MKTMKCAVLLCYVASLAAAAQDALDVKCSEYCVVTFQLLHGADIKPRRLVGMGEANQRPGAWADDGNRAMVLCGYLFPATRPVVDVTPDSPKPAEALSCRIVVPSVDPDGRTIKEYRYVWMKHISGQGKHEKWEPLPGQGKTEEAWSGKWPEIVGRPTLPAGVTKAGERWACWVVARVRLKGEVYGIRDEVVISGDSPGDSLKKYPGWAFG